ncbi:hypothetical protein QU738_28205 (plasmid) [Klebsiella pneumoniae]|nr:hypothetical protein QU738_28205 [Klebsiella pneumoniae]
MSDFWARMRLEILRSNGVEYQRLFETVMELSYPEKFRKVKPWGRKGDGGNDGYIPERGEYYQVYAPEELNRETIKFAIKKMKADVEKIKESWNESCEFKVFYAVINDKEQGFPKEIYTTLAKIKEDYKLEHADVFSSSSLHRLAMKLPASKLKTFLNVETPSYKKEMVIHNYLVRHLPLDQPGLFVTNLSANYIEADTLRDLRKIVGICNQQTYDIPGFKEAIEAMYPWILALEKHFMEFRYMEMGRRGYMVLKSRKKNEPYEMHENLQKEHDLWGENCSIICNNLCYTINQYIQLYREYINLEFLDGNFMLLEDETLPGELLNLLPNTND